MGAARGAFAAGVPIEKHHVALQAEPPIILSVAGGSDAVRKIEKDSLSSVRSAPRADTALVAGVEHRVALHTEPPVRLLTHNRNLQKQIGRCSLKNSTRRSAGILPLAEGRDLGPHRHPPARPLGASRPGPPGLRGPGWPGRIGPLVGPPGVDCAETRG